MKMLLVRNVVVCVLAAVSCAASLSIGSAHQRLGHGKTERVDLVAKSVFSLEEARRELMQKNGTTTLSKSAAEAKQAKVLEGLASSVTKLEENVAKIETFEKRGSEHSNGVETAKPADRAMMEKMDEFDARMNRKARLGAMDVISKLGNAMHLVKKGALTGNSAAKSSLDDLLSKMGQMTGTRTGNFLH